MKLDSYEAPNEIIVMAHKSEMHSFAVERCLRSLGESCRLLLADDPDVLRSLSLSYRDNGEAAFAYAGNEIRVSAVKSSLCRRLPVEYPVPEGTWSGDRFYIDKQFRLLFDGLLSLLDDTFAVNSRRAVTYATKIRQLAAAKEAGLNIPRTLISSDPERIRDFRRGNDMSCVKSLQYHSWKREGKLLGAYTTKIPADFDLPNASVALNPNIYQVFERKKFEYRLTIFGEYSAAVRIDNQKYGDDAAEDYRVSDLYLNQLTYVELPEVLVGRARDVLKKLGLRFGTFDFAETTDGEFVFFEVNESGAFLWQELHCDDVYLLEPFCRFLCEANDAFVWDRRQCSESLSARTLVPDVMKDTRFSMAESRSAGAVENFMADEPASL